MWPTFCLRYPHAKTWPPRACFHAQLNADRRYGPANARRVSARASKGKHPTKEAAMREAMEAEAREQAAMDARMVATSMFVKQEPRSYSRSYSSFPTPTVLPQSHKIARGRGRKKQLDAMSTEQKQAEK